jgi:hypothetical protein
LPPQPKYEVPPQVAPHGVIQLQSQSSPSEVSNRLCVILAHVPQLRSTKAIQFFGYLLCFWITIGVSTFNNTKPAPLCKVEVAHD